MLNLRPLYSSRNSRYLFKIALIIVLVRSFASNLVKLQSLLVIRQLDIRGEVPSNVLLFKQEDRNLA